MDTEIPAVEAERDRLAAENRVLREALRAIADLPALPPLPGVMPAAMVRQAAQAAIAATSAYEPAPDRPEEEAHG